MLLPLLLGGSKWSGGEENDAEGLVESARLKSVGGMTAAAQGVVDDSAFEVRLMGGLAVLKDGRDPLYVMQATVNATTALVMAWTLVALLLAWRDSSLEWWWLAGSFILTFSVGLVISLEMLLSHDAELLRKLSRFAKDVSTSNRCVVMGAIVLVVQWIGALWRRTLAGNCRRLGDIILSDRWLESIQVRKDPMEWWKCTFKN